MGCPCFITDDIGFCGEADFMYIPGIDEMEMFCFTHKFGSCKLFKNKEAAVATISSKYIRPIGDLFISTGRHRKGSESRANRLSSK